jgi:hypothetical protein
MADLNAEVRDMLLIVPLASFVSNPSPTPFKLFGPDDRPGISASGTSPYRDRPRTLDVMIEKLMAWFVANPEMDFETAATFEDKDISKNRDPKKGKLAA